MQFATNADLGAEATSRIARRIAVKLAELETKLGIHDQQLSAIIAAIRQLTSPEGPRHRRKIGFHQGNS